MNDTLCWKCQNACGNCAWSRWKHNQPVEGWLAMPIKIKLGGGDAKRAKEYIDSYIVLECPEFLEDEPREKYEY